MILEAASAAALRQADFDGGMQEGLSAMVREALQWVGM